MIKIAIENYFVISILILSASGIIQNHVFADDTGSFAILASTYTNTSPGTSITGNIGYTTGPAVVPTINGVIHTDDSTYSQAGIAQNTAISSANSQVCTTNLGTTVDLSLVHGGVYTPGVYCTTGAASIGTGGITLSGDGIYLFQIGGALTTVVNSAVNLSDAQASNISWVPTGATTLGANTKFAGIILDASGVTIGSGVSILGKVLAFGGTVSTDADTIMVSKDVSTTTPPPTTTTPPPTTTTPPPTTTTPPPTTTTPPISGILSPLEQFKSGIAAKDVTCKQGLELILKATDSSPACVKPNTASVLIQRGWAKN